MKGSFCRGITRADLFADGFFFSIKENYKSKTVLGGVLFIIYVLVMAVIGVLNFITFCQRSRYTQSVSYDTNDDPVNKLGMMFSIYIDQKEAESSNNIWSMVELSASIKGTPTTLTSCTNAFCLPDDTSLNKDDYIDITLKIKDANQVTALTDLLAKSSVSLVLSSTQTYINMDSVNEPYAAIKETREQPLSININSRVDLLAVPQKIKTDTNPFFTFFNDDEGAKINFVGVSVKQIATPAASSVLCSFHIAPSSYKVVTRVTYQKFLEYLAELVSLCVTVYLILKLIVTLATLNKNDEDIIENSIWYRDKLIAKNRVNYEYLKDLFNGRKSNVAKNETDEILITHFNNKNEGETQRESETEKKTLRSRLNSDSNSGDNISSESKKEVLKMNDGNNSMNSNKINPNDYSPVYYTFLSSDNLRNKYEKKNEKKERMTCCNKILSLFRSKKRNEQQQLKRELFSLVKKEIFPYLDVINYIKKMREVDLMKFILFNKNENTLFQYLTIPSYSLSLDRQDIPLCEIVEKFDFSREQIENIYNAYMTVYNEARNPQKENLLKLMSYELYQLIQN